MIYAGVGLGVIALGVGAYYLFFHEKESANDFKEFTPLPESNKPTITQSSSQPKNTSSSSYTPPKPPAGFPLKKGSRGALVKQLQEALIASYGKSILPKYGADGDFGSETVSALTKKGYPTVIDEITFNKIINAFSVSTSSVQTPTTTSTTLKTTITNDQAIQIASELIANIKAKKPIEVMTALLKIKNVADYSLVNEPFKTFALDGHNQSIVNGVLSAWDEDYIKVQFKSRFLQIGLKYNASDNKWSLSGFPSPRLITTCETIIRNKKGYCLSVPASTIIGHEKCSAAGITSFTTFDGQELTVPKKHVRYV